MGSVRKKPDALTGQRAMNRERHTRSAPAQRVGRIIIAVKKADCREDNDMAHSRPTRRSLLQGTLAASALSLTGVPPRAEPQWEKYAGSTIEAHLINRPRG